MATTVTEVISKVQARNQTLRYSQEAFKLPTLKNNIDLVPLAEDAAVNAVAGAYGGDGSLVDITRVANIEPRVLIEESLINLPGMEKFLLTLTNFYSAHYLQAVALTNKVGRISVLNRLDQLNTDRSVKVAVNQRMKEIKNATFESLVDYGYSLPKYNKEIKNASHYIYPPKLAMERMIPVNGAGHDFDPVLVERIRQNVKVKDDTTIDREIARLNKLPKERLSDKDLLTLAEYTAEKERREKERNEKLNKEREDKRDKQAQDERLHDDNKAFLEASSKSITNSLKRINDVDNIAVGRMLEVVIQDGRDAITVPVAVRMRPMLVPQLIMRELVAFGDIRESWSERWHRWRAGELSLVSDLIFQTDRINKKRKLIALDKKGIYREMIERRSKNLKAAMLSGNPSLGSASSFLIITKETAKEVEYRTGSPIENKETRDLLFSANSAMMLIIIDREWERIQCYTRGISSVADYSFKQFEGMSKGNGPDISEIMKAYTLGNNPRF